MSRENQAVCDNVTEKDDSEISQIILDIKHGQLSTDQLCECFYGADSLCGRRVIVHTGVVDDIDEDNPGANLNLVGNLVSKMNDFSLRSLLTNTAHVDSQNPG